MSTWEEAQAAATAEEPADAPSEAASGPVTLVVVDHFDFGMVDMDARGARLFVRPLPRLEALALVRARPADVAVMALFERGQSLIEKELGLEAAPRPRVRFGTRLLVVTAVRWNEIHFTLVEFESDGDGCIP